MQFKEIPLTLFKLAPTHEVRINDALKVMVHKRVGFYAVSPERMEFLLKCESLLSGDQKLDISDNLFWDSAIKNQKRISLNLEDLK